MCYILAIREIPSSSAENEPDRSFTKARISSFGHRRDPKYYPQLRRSIPFEDLPPGVLASVELIPDENVFHALTVSWLGQLSKEQFTGIIKNSLAWSFPQSQGAAESEDARHQMDTLAELLLVTQSSLFTRSSRVQYLKFEEGTGEKKFAKQISDRRQRQSFRSIEQPEWFQDRVTEGYGLIAQAKQQLPTTIVESKVRVVSEVGVPVGHGC